MASKMVLERLCLVWFFLQVQSIRTNSTSIVYTIESSTINLTFEPTDIKINLIPNRKRMYFTKVLRLEENKYDIRVRPSIIEFQVINVTSSDTGLYWLYRHGVPGFDLTITNKSCRTPYHECAVNGSSVIHTFIFNASVCYEPGEDWHSWHSLKCRHRISSNALHVDFYIYNVTLEDEGYYIINKIFDPFKLQVSKLWFINQTNLKTIEGQEGEPIEIVCSCDTEQYITALTLKTNGTIKAIGDNQIVSYSFTPDRSDHLTKYQCVDSKHSSIMVEVELSIKYAPVVSCHLTNTTITCDCDGIPKKYSVYRLDQISRNGELVRSVNLNTEIFTFRTDPFPYQKNGIYTCFVSNGIPDTTGKVLQNCSTNVTYEGPPVFSPRNRHVKHGEVGISISMSFYIYSYPAVDEVNIEKIGQKQNKFEKLKTYNILKSTLLYTEFDNAVGVEGYEILIESEVLKIDDFHAYLIIAKNHLGESKYRFEIIDQESLPLAKESLPLAKGKRIMFVIVCCIASILLVYLTITHVCVCVKHVKTRNQRLQNLQEDHLYHTYDEIGTISFRAVSSLHSADIIDNLGQNPTGEHTHNVSVDVNLQSTTDYTTELNAGFLNDGLQREITDVHGQGRSLSLLDTNFSNTDVSSISFTGISRIKNFSNCNQTSRNTDRSREQKSKTCKTCNNSRSWSSNDVMVGNVKNEYENKYQLQDGHQYLETLDDRQFKISATDYSTKNHQKSQTSNDSRPSNNAMVGKARNEYENNYQLQDGNLYFETLDDGQVSIPSTTDSIVKIQQRSQTISDASSGSSDKSRIGNVRNEYENNYQLQDGNLYIEVLDDRPITLSSTDSIAKTHQRSQTISDAASESTSNAMVGNERNEYENNNQMQDGHLYLDILDDRPINLSSTDSIAKNHQRSQTISDAGSESSNNAMVGNERNEYENNNQMQDGHLYLDILDDRPINLSSTDSIAKNHQRSQTISDAGSESSNNAMVGNERNEYENNYQLQDGRLYLDILDDRPITLSSTDSIAKIHQRSQTISDAGSESSNNAMVGNEINEYENNYQLQDSHLCLDILDDRKITVSSSDSIEKYQQRSQTISDADGGSSNNSMLGNERNEYENNYQLQDGHLYLAVLGDRQISISATDSSTNKQQQSQPSDDSDSGSSNNVIVDYCGDGYENPYQMILQDHTESNLYTEIIKDRHSGTSSNESDNPEEQGVQPGSAKE